MPNKKIRIATDGHADDYRDSLVPLTIKSLGYSINWVGIDNADLLIKGPFAKERGKELRWLPKPMRSGVSKIIRHMQNENRPLSLFQTAENVRHNAISCDYSLSSDLAVNGTTHLRFPYWMEMVDWRHEGITGNKNPRYGALLDLQKLQRPLGNEFLKRQCKAAFFTSHLREPRKTLYEEMRKRVDVDGYGPFFDRSLKSHHNSGLLKNNILEKYRFNLCPENSLYPGYLTEKIPEAFAAGTLPITWADINLICDFNADAIINLYPESQSKYSCLDALQEEKTLYKYCDQPLINHIPTIQYLKEFIHEIVIKAIT